MNNADMAKVAEEVAMIAGTLPGKVFYAEDGEALFLTEDGTYIIRITPNVTPFNKGNPFTESAYLYAYPPEPPEEDGGNIIEEPGWGSGWEC